MLVAQFPQLHNYTLCLRSLQSTYCKVIQEHCQNLGRSVHVGNLDPAAEEFGYSVAFGEDMWQLIFRNTLSPYSVVFQTLGT